MELTNNLFLHAVTIVATAAATAATFRTRLASISRRVKELEDDAKQLPARYVPRTEVELGLRGIEASIKQVQTLLLASIYSEEPQRRIRKLEASADPRDFVQICIEGLDGHGGLNRWEGSIPFFYLDNREIDGNPSPLVTVGKGCALGLDEALTLPFTIEGSPATYAEIAADFAAVEAAPFGFKAPYYARFTRCRLSEKAIDELVRKRFAVFICALRRIFPNFDAWPVTAKAGALDLIYGLGPAGLDAPHYPAFRAAASNFNWPVAARESASDAENKAYAPRNEAREQLFLQAVSA